MADSLLVVVGGFLGAIARFGASSWFGRRFPSSIPYGTLFVNLLGSFLLGLLYGSRASPAIVLCLGTGFMGAFTTFSTFTWETIQLTRKKEWKLLILYVSVSYFLGLLFAFLGFYTGA